MDPEIGQVYSLTHTRKSGKAKVRVLSSDPDWVTLEILGGKLKGLGSGDIYSEGDEAMFRISHIHLSQPK